MDTQKIIILDYSDGSVHVLDYDPNQFQDCAEFYDAMSELGYDFRESTCDCMIVDQLKIHIH